MVELLQYYPAMKHCRYIGIIDTRIYARMFVSVQRFMPEETRNLSRLSVVRKQVCAKFTYITVNFTVTQYFKKVDSFLMSRFLNGHETLHTKEIYLHKKGHLDLTGFVGFGGRVC